MNSELKQIKKLYGEEMMHLCRRLFPTILENEGVLLETLQRVLAPTEYLAKWIKSLNHYEIHFEKWIKSCIENEKEEKVTSLKTPEELMDEAGYTLYKCNTEEEIQSFKKYYAPGEELCTFNGGRLNRCHVFFAVKKNVDKIKRKNFPNPKREDEYGTSVISIQFAKNETHTLSIKNRYNHTVSNPDATFSNDLDNIIPGLTDSFAKEYNLVQRQGNGDENFLEILGYISDVNGKYYLHNMEVDAIYYCENNIIIKDGIVIDTYSKDKSRYLVIDQYIIDMQEKDIFTLDSVKNDAFIKSIKDVGKIKNFNIIKGDNDKLIEINYENGEKVILKVNNDNAIISYENNYVKRIGNNFLSVNGLVERVILHNVETIGDRFLSTNDILSEIDISNVKKIGNSFLECNAKLVVINCPEVLEIGSNFLKNSYAKRVFLPKVQIIHDGFMRRNSSLGEIFLPEVIEIGIDFLLNNRLLTRAYLPKVKRIGHHFLYENGELREIKIPELVEVGMGFLFNSKRIEDISIPKLEVAPEGFMCHAVSLKDINIPSVKEFGSYVLNDARNLVSLRASKLEKIGHFVLSNNMSMRELYLPRVKIIGYGFLTNDSMIKKIYMPSVVEIGKNFLSSIDPEFIKLRGIIKEQMKIRLFEDNFFSKKG